MSIRRIVALVVVCLLVVPAAYASHSWGCYHWARTANPFTLKLGDNVTSNWDSSLATTSSDWSKSTVLDTTIVPGQSKGRCRPTGGRDEICNGTYGNNGWLGLAQIWVSGCHITQGSVKVNDTYFNTSSYNTPAWHNLVMCQEVGHTFGLDHQDENFDNANLGTCMDYTSDPSSNQHPNTHDYEQLQNIYSHLDNTTTVGAGVQSALNLPIAPGDDLDAPWRWGTPVGFDAEGRANVYVLDLGDDEIVVTHVIWTKGDIEDPGPVFRQVQ
jgi:hypothetical protein